MTEGATFVAGPPSDPTRYRLTRRIASGSAGEVWQAIWQPYGSAPWPVAIKIAPGSGHAQEAAWWAEFGRRLTAISHPGLARVIDVFVGAAPRRDTDTGNATTSPITYVVMDFIDGRPVSQAGGTRQVVLSRLAEAAAALDELHSGRTTGVPLGHGDVRPTNILVTGTGSVVVVDLGRAQFGTPRQPAGAYRAPETLVAAAVPSPAADAYAFAVTAIAVLTGDDPPTHHAGAVDVSALRHRLHSVFADRPQLVDHLLAPLEVAAADRPRRLAGWLDGVTKLAVSDGGARTVLTTDLVTEPPALTPVAEPIQVRGNAAEPSAAGESERPAAATELSSEPLEPDWPVYSPPEPSEPADVPAQPAGTTVRPTSPMLGKAPREPVVPPPLPLVGPARGGPPPPPSRAHVVPPPGSPRPEHEASATQQRGPKFWAAIAAAVIVVLGGGVTAAVLASGSGDQATPTSTQSRLAQPVGPKTTAPVATPTETAISSEVVPTSTAPSVAPSTSTPPTPVTHDVGDLVVSSDDMASDCTDALSEESNGSFDFGLDNGTAIISCSSDSQVGVVAVKASTGEVLWSSLDFGGSDDSTDDNAGTTSSLLPGGGQNLYVLTIKDHPAAGLKDEFWTRSITAYSAQTGAKVWTGPLLTRDRATSDDKASIYEQTDPHTGKRTAIIKFDSDDSGTSYSGFDAVAGTPLWVRTSLTKNDSDAEFSDLPGNDESVAVFSNDNSNPKLQAMNLTSLQVVWTTTLSESQYEIITDDQATEETIGSTYWVFNTDGYDASGAFAIDLNSGRVINSSVFPSNFSSTLVTPRYTVAQVGNKLKLWRTGHLDKPVWSVPSDGAAPTVATSKAIFVDASSGTVALNPADGSILNGQFDFEPQAPAVAGLANTDGGLVEVGVE